MSQVSLSYHNTPMNDSYQRSAELHELHENDIKKIDISFDEEISQTSLAINNSTTTTIRKTIAM
jgi:hypothetical protein